MTDMLLIIMILAGVMLAAWWFQRRGWFAGDAAGMGIDTYTDTDYDGWESDWSESEPDISESVYDSPDIDSSGGFGDTSSDSD